jgi:hypothetical protein
MIKLGIAVVLVSACSFGVRGVDSSWDKKSPPVCSDTSVLVDRILGASLIIAASSTIAQFPDELEVGVLVGAPVVGLGILYLISASVGAEEFVKCQTARTQYAYSNTIKARQPKGTTPGSRGQVAKPAVVPDAQGKQHRPWARGVSDVQQATALQLYADGNELFIEDQHALALAKYREAIQHWDHPAIRFNMAVCLIHLEQPVEARENLERSLVHGAPALGADAYRQALAYRKLLDAQLVRLTLECPEPDQELLLDGKLVFKGPGVVELFLLPGEHHLVATKPGFLPASRKIVLVAGQPASYEIRPLIDPRPGR